MSTTAVYSVSINQELQNFYQNRQADLKQLGSALQSGDLNSAEQAYQSLTALGQSGPYASAEPFAKSSKDQAFEAIGQALQTGDLAGAQTAFATLTSKSSSGTTETPATVVNLTSTQTGTAAGSATATDSTTSIYQQMQTYRQDKKTDIAQLGQDLQAGNLNAAQQDVNADGTRRERPQQEWAGI